MAIQTHPHKETAKEKEADEKEANNKKEEGRKDYNAPPTSPFAKGKHDAELIQGGEVPPEEQGRVNESREWIAAEAERQEKADIERFRAERSHAARNQALQEAKK
jgi:hypothetical protein